ncbi:hypothetical protein BSR29_02820 [Boudabousia liubingyangii]|uniref:Peptidase S1 domain-containing protein n=1 Tax=Boudabousia liubingyangii TaxID=1921764 RepID=A0A1Q5PMM1_9ACTO|nr:S1 family peptidase [Boudabousia liubingyangii]OKL48808.1 hypothetical protein BSR29_02820 [Boudabousia liubingyangii]
MRNSRNPGAGRRLLVKAAVLGLGASAWAFNVPAASALVSGTPSAEDDPVAAASVLLVNGSSKCTGVLVAPEWVLTARHCSKLKNQALRNAHAFIGRQMEPDFKPVTVDYFAAAPGGDVALAHLAEAAYDVTPIDIRREPVPVGAEVRTYGWGKGTPQGFGKPIWYGTGKVITYLKQQRPDERSTVAQLDLGNQRLGNGDSGGPVVYEGKVAFVNSGSLSQSAAAFAVDFRRDMEFLDRYLASPSERRKFSRVYLDEYPREAYREGEPVVVSAKVDPIVAGTVSFFANGELLTTVPVQPDGMATATIRVRGVSKYYLDARFNPTEDRQYWPGNNVAVPVYMTPNPDLEPEPSLPVVPVPVTPKAPETPEAPSTPETGVTTPEAATPEAQPGKSTPEGTVGAETVEVPVEIAPVVTPEPAKPVVPATPETVDPVVPTPEAPKPVKPTPEAPKPPVKPTPEVPAKPAVPTPELPAQPVAPIPEAPSPEAPKPVVPTEPEKPEPAPKPEPPVEEPTTPATPEGPDTPELPLGPTDSDPDSSKPVAPKPQDPSAPEGTKPEIPAAPEKPEPGPKPEDPKPEPAKPVVPSEPVTPKPVPPSEPAKPEPAPKPEPKPQPVNPVADKPAPKPQGAKPAADKPAPNPQPVKPVADKPAPKPQPAVEKPAGAPVAAAEPVVSLPPVDEPVAPLFSIPQRPRQYTATPYRTLIPSALPATSAPLIQEVVKPAVPTGAQPASATPEAILPANAATAPANDDPQPMPNTQNNGATVNEAAAVTSPHPEANDPNGAANEVWYAVGGAAALVVAGGALILAGLAKP